MARSSFFCATIAFMCWNTSGFEYFRLRSSISFFTSFIPSLPARGAHISITSVATSRCASGVTVFRFLIRSSLSASFTSMTRMSSTMAKTARTSSGERSGCTSARKRCRATPSFHRRSTSVRRTRASSAPSTQAFSWAKLSCVALDEMSFGLPPCCQAYSTAAMCLQFSPPSA